ncbi:hypothetical protein QN224_13305 [Sinorhizobium sp. 8-89]|uniref:hypothetical protein n=1 Tax=Sinorhizobium sp. 7-81 TaxID=3049087 RepID=UPI0024C2603D|nr:hypothetical protein [Sinorhizobium sp. 7-81]MDK1386387.1 hypothetical protein [Sinorhizobium sp. 7-81]
MPGSADNPVVLDPFRTIIEVGWNSVTHLAFYVEVGRDFENNSFADRPPIPADPPDIPPGDWGTTWITNVYNGGTLTESVLYIGSGGPHAPHIYRSSSGWQSAGAVPIDGGLPPFTDSVTYGALDHLWNPFFGPLFEDLWKMTPGGSGAGLTVPGEPDITFDSNTSPHAFINHNAIYTGAPYWGEGPGSSFDFGAYTAAQETAIIDLPYPAGDIVARYSGRAFRGCSTAFHDPGSGPKRLWILCERSPDDD